MGTSERVFRGRRSYPSRSRSRSGCHGIRHGRYRRDGSRRTKGVGQRDGELRQRPRSEPGHHAVHGGSQLPANPKHRRSPPTTSRPTTQPPTAIVHARKPSANQATTAPTVWPTRVRPIPRRQAWRTWRPSRRTVWPARGKYGRPVEPTTRQHHEWVPPAATDGAAPVQPPESNQAI